MMLPLLFRNTLNKEKHSLKQMKIYQIVQIVQEKLNKIMANKTKPMK